MADRAVRGARRTVHVVHAIDYTSADCLVEVIDTGCGERPVIVRWPLVSLRFESLDAVRLAFQSFGQFGDVRWEIKGAVDDCVTEIKGGTAPEALP